MKYVGGKPSDNVSLKKKVLKYLIRYIEIGNIKRNNALLSGNKHGNHLNTALIIRTVLLVIFLRNIAFCKYVMINISIIAPVLWSNGNTELETSSFLSREYNRKENNNNCEWY